MKFFIVLVALSVLCGCGPCSPGERCAMLTAALAMAAVVAISRSARPLRPALVMAFATAGLFGCNDDEDECPIDSGLVRVWVPCKPSPGPDK